MKHKEKALNIIKIAVFHLMFIFPSATYGGNEPSLDFILAISCDAWNTSKSSSEEESPPNSPKEARILPESTATQDLQEKETQVPIAVNNKKRTHTRSHNDNKKNKCCLS